MPDLRYSVSFTTRAPRVDEVAGRDYFFVSEEEFRAMELAGEFLEWAVVHGNLYGTARSQVDRELASGHDIVLEIDVQGADIVSRAMPEAITVFILPPSFEVLRDRLLARGSENMDDVELRLRNSRVEVSAFRRFQYVIFNDDLETAAGQLASVIYTERSRRERQEAQALKVLESFLETAESGD